MKQLILGGARSGKSRLAEQLALASTDTLLYIATADPQQSDQEMQQRIAHHRDRRDERWQLIEEPLALAATLCEHSRENRCIVVDCLTLWLSNCLLQADTTIWPTQQQALLECLPTLPGQLILVSNEVGMGIVPLGEISRRFVDEAGFLHQALGQGCDRVIFTAAGLPLVMKGPALGDHTNSPLASNPL